MVLGTDVDIKTCIAEGYTMIEYDGRKTFNKDLEIRIFSYYPEYFEGEARGTILTDCMYSFNELNEFYKEDKKSLDKMCETDKHVDFINPTYRDFLNLASDLDWAGLLY